MQKLKELFFRGKGKYKMTLDNFLNVVVPLGIFIAIGIFIYSRGKKHIDKFFKMFKSWFQPKDSEEEGGNEPLNYKINYRGAEY